MTEERRPRRRVAQAVDRLAAETPEIGHLLAAAAFKRSMVEHFGVERALALCREHLQLPGAERVRRRVVVPLRTVAERTDELRELWPGGRPFVHPAPPVVGEGDHIDQHGVGRAGYLACVADALVRGRSAVVLVGDVAAVDFEEDEPLRFADEPLFDPALLAATDESLWTIEPADGVTEIDECFLLTGSYAHDFGHWLSEHLPKLGLALLAGLPEMPILVDERMPATHRQSLALFCPERQVLDLGHLAPCRVRRLWLASSPTYRGFSPLDWTSAWQAMLPDPERFTRTIRRLEEAAGTVLDEPTGADRVFLARRPDRKKRLVNHRRIEEIAAAHGFAVVHPEDLPFVDQLRLVRHARHLVAPDGSAGLLTYFASAGAAVCFLNHPHTRPLVELNGLLAARGASFTIVTGPVAGDPCDERFWSDYTIDEEVFASFLAPWLTAPPAPPAVIVQHPQIVRVEELATVSALALARERGRPIEEVSLEPGEPPLEITGLDDVLYVPSALDTGQSLQVVEGRCLAFEAVFDDFTAQFVRARLLEKGVAELTGFTASDRSGDVCILGNVFSRNFTHWHEELMKVVAIERARLDCAYVVAELPAFARELLRLVGVADERVLEVRRPTRFRRALYGTAVSYRNLSDHPAVLAELRRRLFAAAPTGDPGFGAHLWLDRGAQTRLGRRLVNEEEVHRLLERHGFARIDMGALPAAGQIAAARHARAIAGLHGSQLVHSQLMRQRSAVVECFSPLYLNPTYTEIYRVLQHRYSQVCATNTPLFPYLHGADVRVDEQQLDLALGAASEAESA